MELGTLLQPKMNKRKSVTRLSEKDTKEATKYVLTHQTLDSDGDVQTNLVKGDVVPTSTGGTSVVFHDVEVITQKSPGDRKRRSPSSALRPEDYDGEWTDVETRCSIAIEGHVSSKKPKTSAV
jgi:kinesin family protein 23